MRFLHALREVGKRAVQQARAHVDTRIAQHPTLRTWGVRNHQDLQALIGLPMCAVGTVSPMLYTLYGIAQDKAFCEQIINTFRTPVCALPPEAPPASSPQHRAVKEGRLVPNPGSRFLSPVRRPEESGGAPDQAPNTRIRPKS